MLFLSLACFALALLGVIWVVRAYTTKDETPTERADLDRVGGIIFTVVCLSVGGVALYLHASDVLEPEPGLVPNSGAAPIEQPA